MRDLFSFPPLYYSIPRVQSTIIFTTSTNLAFKSRLPRSCGVDGCFLFYFIERAASGQMLHRSPLDPVRVLQMAPLDETPAEQSGSTCEGKVLKVITKGWRHRAHPDPAAQPRPLMKRWRWRRRGKRRSAGVFPRSSSSSRGAALFLPHRLNGWCLGGRKTVYLWSHLGFLKGTLH